MEYQNNKEKKEYELPTDELTSQKSWLKNLLSKDISKIKIFKKISSISIDQTLSSAIIFWVFLLIPLFFGYLTIKSDDDVGIGWILFLSLLAFLFWYSFIVKLSQYIRSITAKIKIRKWNMAIIQDVVIWFQHTADGMSKSYYHIICTDWISEFFSEETAWQIHWFNDDALTYLRALKIIYDPKNPQKTLYELDNHPKRMMVSGEYEATSNRLTKQISAWESFKQAYWIFNRKRITVWDTINVYIDPNNKNSYLVDLSFLK